MKIKVADLFNKHVTLLEIINSKRPMPQLAHWRVACAYGALLPHYEKAAAQRDELISKFGDHKIVDDKPTGEKSIGPTSPNWEAFAAEWEPILKAEVEVAVEPIPLSSFGTEGHILAHELVALGELVKAD